MQSKITSFSLANDEAAVLYGNFDKLRPVTVHGVAHAFPNGNDAIVTLYSLTGMQEAGAHICSADLRLAVTRESLSMILSQLKTIQENFFPVNASDKIVSSEEVLKKDKPEKTHLQEKLSAPL